MALLLGRDHLSFPSLVSQQPRGEEHISQENRCTFLVGFIWCERRSFAQEKATSFRESQAVRKGKNNIRSWWKSLQYITWLSFRGCPVVEPFGFRCLEHIPAEMFCWAAVLPAGHVQKHILLNKRLQHFPALHQAITILLAMVKTNRTIKTFPRHAWAVHFRGWGCSGCAPFLLTPL